MCVCVVCPVETVQCVNMELEDRGGVGSTAGVAQFVGEGGRKGETNKLSVQLLVASTPTILTVIPAGAISVQQKHTIIIITTTSTSTGIESCRCFSRFEIQRVLSKEFDSGDVIIYQFIEKQSNTPNVLGNVLFC